jgi:two-component system NarL family sensor kinase
MFSDDQIRLAQGVADSAALAVENASLYARSQGLAIAEERGRLAQEIHDGLAQGLTAISLQLDLADAYLPAKADKAAEKVRRALELSRTNLEEARRSVLDLRAARLQEVALPDALRRLAQRFVDESGIEIEFSSDSLRGRLSARVEMGLLRIAEEALDNIRRHAAAGEVHMSLQANDDQVTLAIEDDGVGFDPQIAARQAQHGTGFGLVGVRERARLLKGSLSIQSARGHGTRLTVTVPYETRQAAHDEKS